MYKRQAYGVAALLGPIIKRFSTSYNQTFMIAMGTAVAGLIVAMLIKDIKEEEVEEDLPIHKKVQPSLKPARESA